MQLHEDKIIIEEIHVYFVSQQLCIFIETNISVPLICASKAKTPLF